MITSVHRHRADSHAFGEDLQLPLHVKNVEAHGWNARLEYLKGALDDDAFIEYRRVVDLLESEATGVCDPAHWGAQSQCTDEDIRTLLDKGLIEAATEPKESDTSIIRVFTVVERQKHRRRWITHTPYLNEDVETSMPQLTLPDPSKMMQRLSWKYAFTCDFAAYYHQFALTTRKFVFRHGSMKFRLRTIPTGASLSPYLAHMYTLAICSRFRQRVASALRINVETDAYIDNVRVLFDDLSVRDQLIDCLFEECEDAKVIINESKEVIRATDPERYDFLGVAYDHHEKFSMLSESFVQKVITAWDDGGILNDPNAQLRDVVSLFGKLQYGAIINGSPRHPFYLVYKFLRRRVGCPLDGPADVWKSTKKVWRAWVEDEVFSRKKRLLRTWATPQATLFTDASLGGFGAVLFGSSGTYIFAGKWEPSETSLHIHILEAKALRLAMQHFELSIMDCGHIQVFIDNTSLLFALRRTHSNSFILNNEIRKIFGCIAFQCVGSVQYVPSAFNAADGPSRGTHESIETGWRWFQQLREHIQCGRRPERRNA
jgi:hypothetical protein